MLTAAASLLFSGDGYCSPLLLQITTVIGGMEQQAQAQAVKRKPHVVVATPGRLAALLEADAGLAAGAGAAWLFCRKMGLS
jgi:superfamily II DNA/RNA helicase